MSVNGQVLAWINGHLKAHGIKYIWTLIVAVTIGAMMNGWALQWFDTRVIQVATAQIIAQTTPIQVKVDAIEKKVDQAAEERKAERIERLETEILSARLNQCRADTTLLRQVYGDEVSRKMAMYQALTNRQYQLLPCSELK